MSDNNIKINVEVGAGLQKASKEFKDLQTRVKELDYEFRKQKVSAEGLKIALTEVEQRAKSLSLSYRQAVDLSAQIYQVNQRATFGFNSLSKSIHDATQNSNRAQQGFVALAYIIQDMPYGIRGVANNITQLSQVLGTPIWLNLAISGFTSLWVVMDANKNKAENLTKAIYDLKKALGTVGLEQYKNSLQGDLFKAKAEYSALEKSNTTTQFRFNPMNPSQFGFTTTPDRFSDEMLAKEKEILEIEKAIKEVEKEITDEKNKQDKLSSKTAKNEFDRFWNLLQLRNYERTRHDPTKLLSGTKKGDGSGGAWGQLRKTSAGGQADMDELSSKFQSDNDQSIQNDLREAMQTANSVFFSPMRNAFESIITGSVSMAEAFEGAIKQMVASLLANAALSLLLTALFPGVGFGKIFMGMSGMPAVAGVAGGGAGALGTAANNLAGGNSGSAAIQVYGETRLSGNDILITYRNAHSRDIRRNA